MVPFVINLQSWLNYCFESPSL